MTTVGKWLEKQMFIEAVALAYKLSTLLLPSSNNLTN